MSEQGVSVRLAPWAEADLPLLRKLVGDPAMMEHLGGPESLEKIADRHARYLAHADRDPQFRIVDVATGEGVGWVGYWERTWRDRDIYEIGWSVLPGFQGRGIASAAAAQAIAHLTSPKANGGACGAGSPGRRNPYPKASGGACGARSPGRRNPYRQFLHAFPAADNPPSNAICRKLGFTLIEQCEFEYPPGNLMICNDWRL